MDATFAQVDPFEPYEPPRPRGHRPLSPTDRVAIQSTRWVNHGTQRDLLTIGVVERVFTAKTGRVYAIEIDGRVFSTASGADTAWGPVDGYTPDFPFKPVVMTPQVIADAVEDLNGQSGSLRGLPIVTTFDEIVKQVIGFSPVPSRMTEVDWTFLEWAGQFVDLDGLRGMIDEARDRDLIAWIDRGHLIAGRLRVARFATGVDGGWVRSSTMARNTSRLTKIAERDLLIEAREIVLGRHSVEIEDEYARLVETHLVRREKPEGTAAPRVPKRWDA